MLLNYLLPVVVSLVSLARADYTITVHNNCDEVIYAAAGETNAGFAMDPSPPSQADFESGRIAPEYHSSPALKKGETWLIKPKAKWIGGRVWARTGCTGSPGNLVCKTGDCGPTCAQPYIGAIDQVHSATLSEFGWGHHNPELNRVFINLSRNQGWNVGVAIEGGTRAVSCPDETCGVNQAYSLSDPSNSASELDADAASAQLKVTFCPTPAARKLRKTRNLVKL